MNIRRMITLFLLTIPLTLVGLSLAAFSSAQASQNSKPDQCIALHESHNMFAMRSVPVTLKGKVEVTYNLGPAGYGENPRLDRKETAHFLKLDKPIDICYFGAQYKLYGNITKLGTGGYFVDQNVKTSGFIYEPDTAEAMVAGIHFNLWIKKVCLLNRKESDNDPTCKTPTYSYSQKLPPIFGTLAVDPDAVGTVENMIDTDPQANGSISSGMVLSPNGKRAYVSGRYGDVSVISLRNKKVVKIIHTSRSTVTPSAVSAAKTAHFVRKVKNDWSEKFKVNLTPQQQSSLRDAVNSVQDGPCITHGEALDQKRSLLYLTCGGLGVVNLKTGKLMHWLRTGDAQDVATGPDGQYVFVANFGKWKKKSLGPMHGTVSVIDTHSWRVVRTIPVGDGPISFTLGPKGKCLYVADMMGNTVVAINVKTQKITRRYAVPGGPFEVAVSPNGGMLYVTEAFGDSVAFVKTTDGKFVASVRTGMNPQGIALSSDGKFLYVANYGAGSISKVDTHSRRLIGTLPIGTSKFFTPGIFGLALGPRGNDLYVSDPSTGKLIVVRLNG